jgi:hypothetical protein
MCTDLLLQHRSLRRAGGAQPLSEKQLKRQHACKGVIDASTLRQLGALQDWLQRWQMLQGLTRDSISGLHSTSAGMHG